MTIEIIKSKECASLADAIPYEYHLDNMDNYNFVQAASSKSIYKALLDRALALVGILILLPFLVSVAVLIYFETRKFPFFKQDRIGFLGRPFKIWKFRTMFVSDNGINIKQAAQNDIRITKLGKFLRRSSIDELPQLFNVLKGEMSLIGPRPHAISHDIYYSSIIKNYKKRHCAKPGMTGLAQINGYRGPTEKNIKMEKRIQKDCEYIENWSLSLDFKILFKTIFCLNSPNAL